MQVTELTKISWHPGTPGGLTAAEAQSLGFVVAEPAVQPKRRWNWTRISVFALLGLIDGAILLFGFH
jgi:hypothetical protein